MKKLIIFFLSVILIINYVNLAANNYIYSEKEQKTSATSRLENELCNFRFVLEDSDGFGWFTEMGIGITVDGVDYGLLYLPFGLGNYSSEEVIALPSGEIQLSWIGVFFESYHFKIYNSSDELIYSSLFPLYAGVFLTYQNECIECVPVTDFEGEYIYEEHQVNLNWKAPESTDLTGFDVYRNDELIGHLPPATTFYSDYTAELEDGNYKYCVIPVYPSICTLEDECFEIYISNVGITNYKNNIMVYPNPATNVINVAGDLVSAIKMYNNTGQLILIQHNTNTINVFSLQNGIYTLSIETSTGHTTQKKLIVNH